MVCASKCLKRTTPNAKKEQNVEQETKIKQNALDRPKKNDQNKGPALACSFLIKRDLIHPDTYIEAYHLVFVKA